MTPSTRSPPAPVPPERGAAPPLAALRLLAEAGLRLGAELDPRATAAALADLVAPELTDLCQVALLGGDGLVADEALRGPTAEAEAHLRRIGGPPPYDPARTLVGAVLRAGDVTPFDLGAGWPADLAADEAQRAAILGLEAGHVLGLPLRARGRLLGALLLWRRRPRGAFAPDEAQLAEALAERAAQALDNGRLYQEARRAVATREQALRIAAHDLRGPLNAVSLAAGRLGFGRDLDAARVKTIVDTIKEAVRRGNGLIDDLLAAARANG